MELFLGFALVVLLSFLLWWSVGLVFLIAPLVALGVASFELRDSCGH